jgi:tyrosinase
MSDLSKLGYDYDDLSAPPGHRLLVARLQDLGAGPAVATAAARRTPMAKTVELLGANKQSIRLSGTEARSSVSLDSAVQQKVSAGLRAMATTAAASAKAPDRIFLNLENVRGLSDATAFNVYVNLPDGADPAKYPDNLAGSIALFGVRKASVANAKHAGNGLTFVLEITHVIDKLHLAGAFDANQLHVRLVPLRPVPDEAQISIEGISIFRQSH